MVKHNRLGQKLLMVQRNRLGKKYATKKLNI